MSPLCIWTVHMSQGAHVWSLHGSILCTHWNILHLYLLRKNDTWVLQAILDYAGHLENLDYKSHHAPTSLSPGGYSILMSIGHWPQILLGIFYIGLQIHHFLITHRQTLTSPVEMDHNCVNSLYAPQWSTLHNDKNTNINNNNFFFFTWCVQLIEFHLLWIIMSVKKKRGVIHISHPNHHIIILPWSAFKCSSCWNLDMMDSWGKKCSVHQGQLCLQGCCS